MNVVAALDEDLQPAPRVEALEVAEDGDAQGRVPAAFGSRFASAPRAEQVADGRAATLTPSKYRAASRGGQDGVDDRAAGEARDRRSRSARG